MRLLFISNLFPDTLQPWCGLDNATLLHAMREVQPDTDIRVLCLRPGHAFWTGRPSPLQPRTADEVLKPRFGWAPYLPKLGGLNDWLFALGVRRALRTLPPDWRPDALLVPWLFPDGCAVNRLRSLARLPMVSVAQGSDVHHFLNLPMRRLAILKLAKRARIVTRSEDLRQRLIQAGASGQGVTTIYNGVDTRTFRPGDRTEARAMLSLPLDGRMLLFVGNFLPVKGADLLIRAAALAAQEMPEPLRLVMVGSGPLQGELMALVRRSSLPEDAVMWVGRKMPAEVARLMQASDAVCLSSHNEGVPNVMFEAIACGRPFVCTRVGGIAEILDTIPGGGMLVRGRDSRAYARVLLQVLASPPDANVLSRSAARFAWQRSAEAYWREIRAASSIRSRGGLAAEAEKRAATSGNPTR